MIEPLSLKLATKLKEANPEHPASLEVLKFSIAAVINVIGTIILALSLSFVLNHIAGTALALISFAALRAISGGYHLNSSMACMLITSITANLIPYINLSTTLNIGLTIFCLLLALLYAPSNIENQSRIPRRYYPLLKVVSAILIASNFFIQSDIIAISFLLQVLSLIRIGGEKT
ncbi:accessory gene regulator ArgB-like protein [Cohnella herbarum]|uniref:Accessory regulator AgrB n=1 Tax=Cohnella herbarum TaxID=2728023 RepID=A0A7Z2VN71_9BACL|nr:accessory gene regulator B family protein [Cohnella herbarum]QJD85935.1 accessory regulator AgrB [Cohnella herbarum]